MKSEEGKSRRSFPSGGSCRLTDVYLQNKGLTVATGVSCRTPTANCVLLTASRSKAALILSRENKGFDHLGVDEVAIKLIELAEPEVIASVVRVLRIIWVAAQIAEVLYQHKSTVPFSGNQVRIFGDCSQDLRSRLRTEVKLVNQLSALCRREHEIGRASCRE